MLCWSPYAADGAKGQDCGEGRRERKKDEMQTKKRKLKNRAHIPFYPLPEAEFRHKAAHFCWLHFQVPDVKISRDQ